MACRVLGFCSSLSSPVAPVVMLHSGFGFYASGEEGIGAAGRGFRAGSELLLGSQRGGSSRASSLPCGCQEEQMALCVCISSSL